VTRNRVVKSYEHLSLSLSKSEKYMNIVHLNIIIISFIAVFILFVVKQQSVWNMNEVRPVCLTPIDLEELFKSKVKVKLSLCLTKHHAIKTYLGVEV
jgi:hypothetical protein